MRTCLLILLLFFGWGHAGGQSPTSEKLRLSQQPRLTLSPGGHTAQSWRLFAIDDGETLVSMGMDNQIRFWTIKTGECTETLYLPDETLSGVYAASLTKDQRYLAVSGPSESVVVIDMLDRNVRSVFAIESDSNLAACCFAPDGSMLLTGGSDGILRSWDWKSGTLRTSIDLHKDDIRKIAFDEKGDRFAVATGNGTCQIFDRVFSSRVSIRRNGERPNCVTFLPSSLRIAIGWEDGVISIHDRSGNEVKQFPHPEHWIQEVVADSSGERILFTTGWYSQEDRPLCGILNLSNQEELLFRRHTNLTTAGVFLSDSKYVATLGGNSNEICVWNAEDGTLTQTLASRGRAIWSVGWDPEGTRIGYTTVSSPSSDAEQPFEKLPFDRIFDLKTLSFVSSPDRNRIKWHYARTEVGPWSLRSNGDDKFGVWKDGRPHKNLRFETDYENRYNTIRSFSLLTGDRAAVGADYGLAIFDLNTGLPVQRPKSGDALLWSMATSPNQEFLLTGGNDQTLRIWACGDGVESFPDDSLLNLFVADEDWIAWTPNGYYAASPGGEQLMGWRVSKGPEQLASFYSAGRFRESLYRPELIKSILEFGSVEDALKRSGGTQSTQVANVLPPVVLITSPEPSQHESNKNQVTIRAAAVSVGQHPVRRMKLLVNGAPYQGKRSEQVFADAKLGTVRAQWELDLPEGEHGLIVLADSDVSQGISSEMKLVIRGAEQDKAPGLPSIYVLAVGVSNYDEPNLRLNFAALDAEAIAATFREECKALYQRVETKLVVDDDATGRGILAGLVWLRRQMTQHDVAVFFFAGHGAKDADGTFYLLPRDVDPEILAVTGVSQEQIKTLIAAIPGRRIIMLDACHAGATTGDTRRAGTPLLDDLARDLATDDFGVITMCSAMGREFASESSRHRHGLFTLAVIEGLGGKADLVGNDHLIYIKELDAYVSERVKLLTNGQQHPVTSFPGTIRSFPIAGDPNRTP